MRKILILALFLIPSLIFGQELWTLEKCISYAWENNLSVKQQELSVEQTKNELERSKYDFIPSVSGSIGHSMNWGRSVDLSDLTIIKNALSQNTSASLSSSITLLEGLSKLNTLKGNKILLSSSLQEVEKLKNDISISITKAFLQVLLSKQILKTADENFKSISQQCERTRKLVDAGQQAYSTLLEIESQLATERVQMVQAQNNVTTNTLTLMQLLDLQYDPDFDVSAPNLDFAVDHFTKENIDSLYTVALVLPQIKSAELSLEKSKIDLSIAKGQLYPSISLSAGYGSYASTNVETAYLDQFNENRNPSISLGLRIPIFNNLSLRTRVKNAKIDVQNKELSLRNSRQTLYKDIQLAVAEAASYYESLRASEVNLKAIQESFRYVQQKFDVGTLNGTDYTVAKTNLFKAQSDYYQAKYQFVFQLKIIDFYKGIPISL